METANEQPVRKSRFPKRFVLVSLLLMALIVFFISFGKKAFTAPRGSVVKHLSEMKNLEPAAQQLAPLILQVHSEYQRNTQLWSLAYNFCAFFSIALSALAGVVLKLESVIKNEMRKKDMAAVLAVSAAILGTICLTGGFQRKWEANRIATAQVEALAYDLMQRGYDGERALAALRGISLQRNLEVVSQEPPKISESSAGASTAPSNHTQSSEAPTN